ncbi:MAG: hypothetical protein JXB15_02600 [Anaerolineales bacterium]|nr:hypothetical protein [Anaerolineales bacterium]
MISLDTARRLKAAGLKWQPALHDFFAIPDRGMNEQIFVISDLQVTVENQIGEQILAFQGASEWALDSLVIAESIWLPTEEQLRLALEETFLTSSQSGLRLTSSLKGCCCEIHFKGQHQSFESRDASEAYAQALLFVLEDLLDRK